LIERRLKDWAAARGFGLALAGSGVLEAVRKKLEERRAAGMIDPDFFKDNLDWFPGVRGRGAASTPHVHCHIIYCVHIS
jgi:hypothetical protein